ncbi:MAG: hypothetical protein Q8O67_08500 [Deltaproteobacteria bacterium]|nr:hypothetical protein [Deltaproteobacteria bacterium]
MATLKETEADLRLRVLLVQSDVVPDEDRVAAVEVLGAGGKLAIPLLVEKLAGDDVEFPATRIETGPMNPGPPATMTTTARFQIERALYRIVSPHRATPAPKNDLDALKPAAAPVEAREPLRYVDDWPAFWSAHKSETLEQMRAWAADEIDRRWSALVKGNRPTSSPSAPSQPATVRPRLDDKETRATRATFATLRDAFERAKANPADRPAAVQLLKADKTPALKPHVSLMLAALGA